MDFSTPERALESLTRRRPALSDDVIELAHTMSSLLKEKKTNDDVYVEGCLSLLSSSTTSTNRWESLSVGLYLSTDLLQLSSDGKSVIYVDGPRVPSMSTAAAAAAAATDDDATSTTTANNNQEGLLLLKLSQEQVRSLAHALLEAAAMHLEHKEPRVRTLVAKAVGAVISLNEPSLQEATQTLHNSILASLHEHLKAGRDESVKQHSKSSTGALDDTTGWRALETNWQGLAAYIRASGSQYSALHPLTPELLEACLYCCNTHVNRHVRAAGIAVLEQLVWIATKDELVTPTAPLRQTVVAVLKVSLADNWSQVRMAASVLCRVLWQQLLQYPLEDRNVESLYPTLLPRMCLNRFYLAQGVKLYSHDTWKLLFSDGGGLEAIAGTCGAVCRYYVQMCDADNHAVREAACQAVAELATKIGSHESYAAKLQPHVPTLLQALIMCFHDESWPVRDEACLACGQFCRAYPEECRSDLPLLKERWLEQLTDQIWSVRQDAGVALGDALLAYPTEMSSVILETLQTKMRAAKDQAPMTKEQYKAHVNDLEAHSEQQLYSCGSLAPKLRKGGAGRIGCGNCGVTRPKAPWEATDGCIYLLREVIVTGTEHPAQDGCLLLGITDETLLPLMQEMADVGRVNHFAQSDDMRTTLFRQLPIMARALGKQRFKRTYLQLFCDLILQALDSRTESALSQHAAGQCCEELGALVGHGIFRGRLDDYQQPVYDRVMQERREQNAGGHMMMEAFASPFGPPQTGGGFGASPFGPNAGAAAAAGVPGN
eukprot:CAMPEP_0119004190 /NCGR_PEP_ID=MMETSP1176-20130426/1004_1 /TAXON_ID=265551 /ORGANISM="Synedropsis recta cf, Strain CCMP1620" /LENGTH=772 /DNA_ID=CAMNT_0006955871 /DNA_START=8 /DNA_END=2326 /DNA_ORIENTATION=-